MNELIKQARELCDAATPGPWIVYESGNTVKSHMVITRSPWKCVTGGISPKTHNAAFIAASRTLVPQLCDALEAMTAHAEKAEAELNIVYELADNMANGTHEAVQAYEDWLRAGETVYEEGE